MKSIFTFILALISITTFAQKEFQGKATYMSKTTVDMNNFGRPGGPQMTEARKKEIAQRMKSMLEKTFILTFDKTSSVYKEDEKLAAPTSGGGSRFMGMMGGSGVRYKNTKDKVALESTEFFGKKFLVSDEMKNLEWELGSETKQIGNYTCFKATLVKEVDPLDFSNMRRPDDKKKEDGEKKSDKVEKPKQIIITAWYTPQIPVSNGPGEYWGLPGLILEINSGRTTILCTEIVMNPTEKKEIKAPTKGKEITREKYTITVKKKMEEMRERFKNRRGNGGRGPH
ncbi:GLPGLI family protein [Polaribacter sp. SA4-12]|uniref:GLPGLI family protein n=1 Tax=Polaribacter sp. SA4-12 TaxID=1312072 RepID=UPI000B3C3E6D|nr:GLPGLI family protein [Polaribacter sp. SA4-12]ARV16871.1 ribonuclease Z [Polaribacter sp. SA4-12]